jgi:hypothetical protein
MYSQEPKPSLTFLTHHCIHVTSISPTQKYHPSTVYSTPLQIRFRAVQNNSHPISTIDVYHSNFTIQTITSPVKERQQSLPSLEQKSPTNHNVHKCNPPIHCTLANRQCHTDPFPDSAPHFLVDVFVCLCFVVFGSVFVDRSLRRSSLFLLSFFSFCCFSFKIFAAAILLRTSICRDMSRQEPIGSKPKRPRFDQSPNRHAIPKAMPQANHRDPSGRQSDTTHDDFPIPCKQWERGHGCNRSTCRFEHKIKYNILNVCHKYLRGQQCHSKPCHRIHIDVDREQEAHEWAQQLNENLSPIGCQQPAEQHFKEIIQDIVNNTPQNEKTSKVKKLLTHFHPDKISDPKLVQFFRSTNVFLTSQLNNS